MIHAPYARLHRQPEWLASREHILDSLAFIITIGNSINFRCCVDLEHAIAKADTHP